MTLPRFIERTASFWSLCTAPDVTRKRCTCPHSRTSAARLPWATDAEYGGWGGHQYFSTEPETTRTPIVFVHGNGRAACDWTAYASHLLEHGARGDDVWAITFEHGASTHVEMANQLDRFVANVREYTGADQVSIVAHSLGVTGARYWLALHDRYDWVSTFIGLAGANHGTSVCRPWHGPFVPSRIEHVCHELRDDYQQFDDHLLQRLNNSCETPGNVEYYTVRGRTDSFYPRNRASPALAGATNKVLDVGHEGVRTSQQTKQWVDAWA